jgi:hypothetical protein
MNVVDHRVTGEGINLECGGKRSATRFGSDKIRISVYADLEQSVRVMQGRGKHCATPLWI